MKKIKTGKAYLTLEQLTTATSELLGRIVVVQVNPSLVLHSEPYKIFRDDCKNHLSVRNIFPKKIPLNWVQFCLSNPMTAQRSNYVKLRETPVSEYRETRVTMKEISDIVSASDHWLLIEVPYTDDTITSPYELHADVVLRFDRDTKTAQVIKNRLYDSGVIQNEQKE